MRYPCNTHWLSSHLYNVYNYGLWGIWLLGVIPPLRSPPGTHLSHMAPSSCLHATAATHRATRVIRLNQVRIADGSQT